VDLQNRTDRQWSRCRLWLPPDLVHTWPADFRINPREWEMVARTKFKSTAPTPKGWDKAYHFIECAEGSGYLNIEK
jgi:hypothetical protein